MKTVTKSLITLAAIAGATAAFAGDQIRDRSQLQDGSCLTLNADGTTTVCPRLVDQDQIRDRTPLRLQDGSCLDGDGVPNLDGTGLKAQAKAQSRAQAQAQAKAQLKAPSPARGGKGGPGHGRAGR